MSPGILLLPPRPFDGTFFVLGFVVSIIIISFKSWAKEEGDMSNNYRVHYKRGDLEIEVESTDKNYVDQMLNKFVPLSPKPPGPPRKGNRKGSHKGQHRAKNEKPG